jgi:hypothetical protein
MHNKPKQQEHYWGEFYRSKNFCLKKKKTEEERSQINDPTLHLQELKNRKII